MDSRHSHRTGHNERSPRFRTGESPGQKLRSSRFRARDSPAPRPCLAHEVLEQRPAHSLAEELVGDAHRLELPAPCIQLFQGPASGDLIADPDRPERYARLSQRVDVQGKYTVCRRVCPHACEVTRDKPAGRLTGEVVDPELQGAVAGIHVTESIWGGRTVRQKDPTSSDRESTPGPVAVRDVPPGQACPYDPRVCRSAPNRQH